MTLTQAQFDQWLTDLRSGEFAQGRNCLYQPTHNLNCCLFVLAKRIIPEEASGAVEFYSGREGTKRNISKCYNALRKIIGLELVNRCQD